MTIASLVWIADRENSAQKKHNMIICGPFDEILVRTDLYVARMYKNRVWAKNNQNCILIALYISKKPDLDLVFIELFVLLQMGLCALGCGLSLPQIFLQLLYKQKHKNIQC